MCLFSWTLWKNNIGLDRFLICQELESYDINNSRVAMFQSELKLEKAIHILAFSLCIYQIFTAVVMWISVIIFIPAPMHLIGLYTPHYIAISLLGNQRSSHWYVVMYTCCFPYPWNEGKIFLERTVPRIGY